MYHHDTRCPQVVAENKKKQKQAAAKSGELENVSKQPQEQVVRFVKPETAQSEK